MKFSMGMGLALSDRVTVIKFRLLRKLIVWVLPLSSNVCAPGSKLSPYSVIFSNTIYSTRGLVIGGDFSESLLLLLISSVKTFPSLYF